ncbi:MAG: photosystem I reaction center subunit XI, partial [Xenococcus sp. (in: cyanobacteria)]
MDAIQHGGDPQVGNLATPLNSSDISKAFIQNLPAYREGMSPLGRGLEIGMAHGYFIYGPFTLLGPLRGTEYAETAGVL